VGEEVADEGEGGGRSKGSVVAATLEDDEESRGRVSRSSSAGDFPGDKGSVAITATAGGVGCGEG
jgi:hypothetical protein